MIARFFISALVLISALYADKSFSAHDEAEAEAEAEAEFIPLNIPEQQAPTGANEKTEDPQEDTADDCQAQKSTNIKHKTGISTSKGEEIVLASWLKASAKFAVDHKCTLASILTVGTALIAIPTVLYNSLVPRDNPPPKLPKQLGYVDKFPQSSATDAQTSEGTSTTDAMNGDDTETSNADLTTESITQTNSWTTLDTSTTPEIDFSRFPVCLQKTRASSTTASTPLSTPSEVGQPETPLPVTALDPTAAEPVSLLSPDEIKRLQNGGIVTLLEFPNNDIDDFKKARFHLATNLFGQQFARNRKLASLYLSLGHVGDKVAGLQQAYANDFIKSALWVDLQQEIADAQGALAEVVRRCFCQRDLTPDFPEIERKIATYVEETKRIKGFLQEQDRRGYPDDLWWKKHSSGASGRSAHHPVTTPSTTSESVHNDGWIPFPAPYLPIDANQLAINRTQAGDGAIHQLLCDPKDFLQSHFIFMDATLGSEAEYAYSSKLKLLASEGGTGSPPVFYVVEDDSQSSTGSDGQTSTNAVNNCFSAYWLNKNSPSDGLRQFVDIPKKPQVGTMVFTTPLVSGSIVMTDHGDSHFRVYHDPVEGEGNILNYKEKVVNAISAPGYKKMSTDKVVGQAFFYFNGHQWELIVQSLNNDIVASVFSSPANEHHRSRRAPFEGIRLWLASRSAIYDEVDPDRYEAQSKILANKIINSVEGKGKAALITFSNYHSSVVAWDDKQKGPVFYSFNGDGYRLSPTTATAATDLQEEIMYYHARGKEGVVVTKFNNLNTEAMKSVWKREGDISNYKIFSNNCAHLASKLLIAGAGVEEKKSKFKNLKLIQTPKDTRNFGIELKNALPNQDDESSHGRTCRSVYCKLSDNVKRIEKNNPQTNSGKKSSLINKFIATKASIKLQQVAKVTAFKAKQFFRTKFTSNQVDWKQGLSNKQTVFQSFRSKFKSTKPGAKAAAGVAAVITSITQLIEWGFKLSDHLKLDAYNKAINKDDMILSGSLAFVPVLGGFIQKSVDTFCGKNCLSKTNAQSNNAALAREIAKAYRQEMIHYPWKLLNRVAETLSSFPVAFREEFAKDGITFVLYSIPIKSEQGFNPRFEVVIPSSTNYFEKMNTVFIVTKKTNPQSEQLDSISINGEILKRTIVEGEESLKTVSEKYDIVERNTLNWIYPELSVEQLIKTPEYDVWMKGVKRIYTSRGGTNWMQNPNYNPEKAKAEARIEIAQTKVKRDSYLQTLKANNQLDDLETTFFVQLSEVQDKLLSLGNPRYQKATPSDIDELEKHYQALVKMSCQAAKKVEQIIAPYSAGSFIVSANDLAQKIMLATFSGLPNSQLVRIAGPDVLNQLISKELNNLKDDRDIHYNLVANVSNTDAHSVGGWMVVQKQSQPISSFVSQGKARPINQLFNMAAINDLPGQTVVGVTASNEVCAPYALLSMRWDATTKKLDLTPYSCYQTKDAYILPDMSGLQTCHSKHVSNRVTLAVQVSPTAPEADKLVRVALPSGDQASEQPASELVFARKPTGNTYDVTGSFHADCQYRLKSGHKTLTEFAVAPVAYDDLPMRNSDWKYLDIARVNVNKAKMNRWLSDSTDVRNNFLNAPIVLYRECDGTYIPYAAPTLKTFFANPKKFGIWPYQYFEMYNNLENIHLTDSKWQIQGYSLDFEGESLSTIVRFYGLFGGLPDTHFFYEQEFFNTALSAARASASYPDVTALLTNAFNPRSSASCQNQTIPDASDSAESRRKRAVPLVREHAGNRGAPLKTNNSALSFLSAATALTVPTLLTGNINADGQQPPQTLSWLSLDHVIPETLYQSSYNQRQKQLLVINWHLHRIADTEVVRYFISEYTEGLCRKAKTSGERAEAHAMRKMDYAIGDRDDIEVQVSEISSLPEYLRKTVEIRSIRDVLVYFLPRCKVGDFLDHKLAEMASFLLTEEFSCKKFMVGHAPWHEISERICSFDWYEHNQPFESKSYLARLAGMIFKPLALPAGNKFSSIASILKAVAKSRADMSLGQLCSKKHESDLRGILKDTNMLTILNAFLDSEVIVPKSIMAPAEKRRLGLIAPVGFSVSMIPTGDGDADITIVEDDE